MTLCTHTLTPLARCIFGMDNEARQFTVPIVAYITYIFVDRVATEGVCRCTLPRVVRVETDCVRRACCRVETEESVSVDQNWSVDNHNSNARQLTEFIAHTNRVTAYQYILINCNFLYTRKRRRAHLWVFRPLRLLNLAVKSPT